MSDAGVSPNRCFQFHKRSQLLLSTDNEPLPVVAVCVCMHNKASGVLALRGHNPKLSPVSIRP